MYPGGAHLVSGGGEVRCNLLIDLVDMAALIGPAAVAARLVEVHGSGRVGQAKDAGSS